MNLTKNLFLVYSRVQYLSMVYNPAQKERILRKKRNNCVYCKGVYCKIETFPSSP